MDYIIRFYELGVITALSVLIPDRILIEKKWCFISGYFFAAGVIFLL